MAEIVSASKLQTNNSPPSGFSDQADRSAAHSQQRQQPFGSSGRWPQPDATSCKPQKLCCRPARWQWHPGPRRREWWPALRASARRSARPHLWPREETTTSLPSGDTRAVVGCAGTTMLPSNCRFCRFRAVTLFDPALATNARVPSGRYGKRVRVSLHGHRRHHLIAAPVDDAHRARVRVHHVNFAIDRVRRNSRLGACPRSACAAAQTKWYR